MIEVRLLKERYKNIKGLYEAFINDKLENNDEFLSNETVFIESDEKFPIYLAIKNENKRKDKFIETFNVMKRSYVCLDRELTLDARFWHSLLCQNFREYILENYPEVKNDEKIFNNIVLKKFDWENYIYKCLIGTQYIVDNISDIKMQEKYFGLISDNLDVFNYVIKYPIFRNDEFLLKILNIIEKYDISNILKEKLKAENLVGRLAEHYTLGSDERYGRRVLFEFNKSYPILMVPMLDQNELEEKFFEFLSYYYDITKIEKWTRKKDLSFN